MSVSNGTELVSGTTSWHGINVDRNVNLGPMQVTGTGPVTFVKQGLGDATFEISDTSNVQELQTVLDEGTLVLDHSLSELNIRSIYARGGALDASGRPLNVRDELRIADGKYFSAPKNTTVGTSAVAPTTQTVIFEGENSELDLTDDNEFSWHGTLGNSTMASKSGILAVDEDGIAGNTLPGDINVNRFYLQDSPLSTGAYSITATDVLDLHSFSAEITQDGCGGMTVTGTDLTNPDAAKTLTLRGGTVAFNLANPNLSKIGKVAYHLDAGSLAAAGYSNGDEVTAWQPTQTGSYDFTFGSYYTNSTPNYRAAATTVNGVDLPSVYFTGSTDDRLTTTDGTTVGGVVAVLKRDYTNTNAGIWGSSDPGDKGIRTNNTGLISSNNTNNYVTTPTYINGAATFQLPADWALLATNRYIDTPDYFNNANLGWYYDRGRVFGGDYAEFIVFEDNVDLTGPGLLRLGYYMQTKYGLAGSYTNPYTTDASNVSLVIEDCATATTLDLSNMTSANLFANLTMQTGADLILDGDGSGSGDAGSVSFQLLQGGENGTFELNGANLIVGRDINDASISATFAGDITDGNLSTLEKIGTHRQILSGNCTFTGLSTVTSGVLQIGDGGTRGTLSGDISINTGATLEVNRSDEYTLASNISGPGLFLVNNQPSGITVASTDINAGLTQVERGALQLGDGATLGAFTPSQFFVNTNGTLAFDLPTTGFGGAAHNFDLALGTLRLRGGYTGYNKPLVDAITSGGASLGGLTVDPGTTLRLDVSAGNTNSARIVATNQIAVDPASLTVDLTQITESNYGEVYNLLQITSGNAITHFDGTTNWTDADGIHINTLGILPNDTYFWDYNVENGLLNVQLGRVVDFRGERGITNPDALQEIIYQPANPGSPTDQLRSELIVAREKGASVQDLDTIIQQFIPSMAAATYAQAAVNNREMLYQIGKQIEDPWEVYWANPTKLRQRGQGSQRNRLADSTFLLTPSRNSNVWYKSFGSVTGQNNKENFAGYDAESYGFVAGIDRKFGKRMLVGGAFGYSDNQLKSRSWTTMLGTTTALPSNSDTQIYTMVAYGMLNLNPTFYVTTKIGGAFGVVSGSRRPTASTQSSYETNTSSMLLQTSLGCRLRRNKTWRLTPKIVFTAYDYNQAGYDEVVQAGTSSVDDFHDTFAEFDLLLDSSVCVTQTSNLYTTVGYRSVIGNDGAVLRSHSDGLVYDVNGIAPASSVFILDVGTDVILTDRCKLLGEYNFRYGDPGNQLHGGTATLVWNF